MDRPVQRQEDDANGYDVDDDDDNFYGGASRPTSRPKSRPTMAEATHEGFVFGDGNGGSNSASNSDEKSSDVKVFKVLVREEDRRGGQRSRQEGEDDGRGYEDHSIQRSSSVVTFSDEQNGGRSTG